MKNARDLVIVILLLSVGLLIVVISQAVMKMETGLIIALIILPAVVYAIISRQIGELDLGLLKIKSSNDPIKFELGAIGPSQSDIREVGDKGFAALAPMIEKYDLSAKPIVLTVKLGRGDYPLEETCVFIEKLMMYPNFKFVVFMDENEYVDAMLPHTVREILSRDEGETFIARVNTKEKYYDFLNRYTPVHIPAVREDASIKDVLKKMTETKLDAFIVVDDKNQLRGVVERNQIISNILLKVMES